MLPEEEFNNESVIHDVSQSDKTKLSTDVVQDVIQEGKFNVAIAEGTDVQVGDRYYGLSADDMKAVVDSLRPLLLIDEPEIREQTQAFHRNKPISDFDSLKEEFERIAHQAEKDFDRKQESEWELRLFEE